MKTPIRNKTLPLIACALFASMNISVSAVALDTDSEHVKQFVQRMVTEHNMSRDHVDKLLGDAKIKESILKAMRRPAEKSKPWHEYRKIFVNPGRIGRGVSFWKKHATKIEQIAAQRGVPAEIIVAIIGVETNYGKQAGSYRVIDALSTLAFEYPPRSKFFTEELVNFLLLVNEENIDPLTAKGSYAGAMGAPQFIPSSYRVYSADGDGDGQRDLFGNWDDVFTSIANYFVEHGWQSGEPVVARAQANLKKAELLELDKILPVYRLGFLRDHGFEFHSDADQDDLSMVVNLDNVDGVETWVGHKNFYVITRYNRSKMYAMAVHQLGQAIRDSVENDS